VPKILNLSLWALRNGQVMTCAFGSGGKCSDVVRWVRMAMNHHNVTQTLIVVRELPARTSSDGRRIAARCRQMTVI